MEQTVGMFGDMDLLLLGIAGAGIPVLLLLLVMANSGALSNRRVKRRVQRVRRRLSGADPADTKVSLRRNERDSSIPGLDLLLKRFVPRRDVLRQRLARTGRPITVGQYISGSLALAVAQTGIGALLFGLRLDLALALGIVAGLGVPHMLVGYLAERRIKQFIALFPEGIDLIVRGLKSGLPIAESITTVGQEIQDPVGIEFRRVDQSVRFGQSLEEALWSAAHRLHIPEFKFFVISLSVQRETGGNLAETLENLSDILRRRRQMKLKIKALSGEAKASAYIIGSLPFIMFGLLLLINAGYVLQLFEDPRGLVMVGVGLASLGLGVAVMMKMVRFEI